MAKPKVWLSMLLTVAYLMFVDGELVNLALHKSASTTSGVWADTWLPQGAVDGNNRNRNTPSSCFHARVTPSDWTVDLERPYDLYDIRIYFRWQYAYRSAGSDIYLDNSRSKVCTTLPTTISTNPLDTVCNATGRYVTIRNPGSGDDLLNICEVEIYGCSKETYGVSCDRPCHCDSCSRWTGRCAGDCYAGWRGDRCDTECVDSYGVNCQRSCSERRCAAPPSSCDRFSGSCDSPCLPGWTGSDCVQKCKATLYGNNCSMLCSARHCLGNSSCDHVTGSCDQGCTPGWQGLNCVEACPNDTYGVKCSGQCAARHCDGQSACGHVTGQCEGGCQPGWAEHDCTVCLPGHYGDDCSGRCESRNCAANSSCSASTGACDGGCVQGYMGADCAEKLASTGTNTTAVVAGVVVTAIVLLVVVIVVILFLRRKRQNENSKGFVDNMGRTDAEGTDSVYVNVGYADSPGPSRVPRRKEEATSDEEEEESTPVTVDEVSYYNVVSQQRQSHQIPVDQLTSRLKELERSAELIDEEFKQLPDTFIHPYDESQKPGNKEKNRFKGYYPYNYNRVVIQDEQTPTRGDYYNASFLDGYELPKRYIAVQGPHKEPIIEDFWRTVWQERCSVVVMVTGLVEGAKMKCLQYWPDEGQTCYGNMMVRLVEERVMADYTTRQLSVRKGKEQRDVTHLHFTTWPDHGVPDTTTLLTFIRRVNVFALKHDTPTVVHCSAGIGRTGTYIAVDSLVMQAGSEGTVDVVSCVTRMRNQRKNMVQNSLQLLFIYQAVTEAVDCGDTSLSDEDIRQLDARHLGDVTMGKKSMRQHIEVLESYDKARESSGVKGVASYTHRYGYYLLPPSQTPESLWNHVYNTDCRTVITWADKHKPPVPSAGKPVATPRFTVTTTPSTLLCDCATLATIELMTKDEKSSTKVRHYCVTGSTRQPEVSVLVESLLQWTHIPEYGATSILSDSPSEAHQLILLANLASSLGEEGRVDIVSEMRRLQKHSGGPSFSLDDVRGCVEFLKRHLESSGVYANV